MRGLCLSHSSWKFLLSVPARPLSGLVFPLIPLIQFPPAPWQTTVFTCLLSISLLSGYQWGWECLLFLLVFGASHLATLLFKFLAHPPCYPEPSWFLGFLPFSTCLYLKTWDQSWKQGSFWLLVTRGSRRLRQWHVSRHSVWARNQAHGHVAPDSGVRPHCLFPAGAGLSRRLWAGLPRNGTKTRKWRSEQLEWVSVSPRRSRSLQLPLWWWYAQFIISG